MYECVIWKFENMSYKIIVVWWVFDELSCSIC